MAPSGEVAALIASGEVAALIASGEVAALIASGEVRAIANCRRWLVNTPTMTDNGHHHNRMIGYLTPDDGSAGAFHAPD